MKLFISRLTLVSGVFVSTLAIVVALGAPASAIDLFPDIVCKGAASNSAACSGTGKDTLSGSDGIIIRVANIMALISGITAVFMFMLGGFFFVTAGGDSGKISSAKKILTYTVVGLITIVLARSIIIFIVSKV